MLNKKMLLSVLILSVVATVAGAGTWAYFDSSQAVNGNTVTSGTLTLAAGQSGLGQFIIGPIAPGNANSAAQTVSVVNTGNLNGHLYAEITATGEGNMPDLTTTINGLTISNGATIDLGTLDASQEKVLTIGYNFEETGADQNSQQGQTVTYDITYHLKQQ